ncbi:MAG: hypothetical protein ACOY5B_04455 [Spirochaetota bacterium]
MRFAPAILYLVCCLSPPEIYASQHRPYAGLAAETVLPHFWFTDSVYTYDSQVDWYRAVRYDMPATAAASVYAGSEAATSERWKLGVEVGYLYAMPVSQTITTTQVTSGTTVMMREKATLGHHIPRLSLRFNRVISESWQIFLRIGIADHIVHRTIDPVPQNLASGMTLRPEIFPARNDVYHAATADLAIGAEYFLSAKHAVSCSFTLNPPIVYPETVRNHIVMPYFATLAFGYRYRWE